MKKKQFESNFKRSENDSKLLENMQNESLEKIRNLEKVN